MHPFPSPGATGTFLNETSQASGLFEKAPNGKIRGVSVAESLCFGHDAQAVLMNMFHHDFFVKHPELKFAIFESNAAWLPALLEKADGRGQHRG